MDLLILYVKVFYIRVKIEENIGERIISKDRKVIHKVYKKNNFEVFNYCTVYVYCSSNYCIPKHILYNNDFN